MPKKTKKEKIIAELRRRLKHVEVGREKLDAEVGYPDILKKADTAVPANQNVPLQAHTSHFTLPTSYIIKDLRKTFILAGLAISLEVMIYWITELGGNRLLKFLPIFR